MYIGGKIFAGVYGAGGQFAAGIIDTVLLNNSTYGFETVLPWKMCEKEFHNKGF
jgi:hypothetical protein